MGSGIEDYSNPVSSLSAMGVVCYYTATPLSGVLIESSNAQEETQFGDWGKVCVWSVSLWSLWNMSSILENKAQGSYRSGNFWKIREFDICVDKLRGYQGILIIASSCLNAHKHTSYTRGQACLFDQLALEKRGIVWHGWRLLVGLPVPWCFSPGPLWWIMWPWCGPDWISFALGPFLYLVSGLGRFPHIYSLGAGEKELHSRGQSPLGQCLGWFRIRR